MDRLRIFKLASAAVERKKKKTSNRYPYSIKKIKNTQNNVFLILGWLGFFLLKLNYSL